ncbi:hypothetical protein [Dyella sp. 2HG41-7]|uniref:hypothetical protein n=1 Tax=Dyella sp. 2HG41-7 TaxID=2883239 RepID=UPI001F44821A|nr:hypothetical protein [Dyella sp. 2HG41-7]
MFKLVGKYLVAANWHRTTVDGVTYRFGEWRVYKPTGDDNCPWQMLEHGSTAALGASNDYEAGEHGLKAAVTRARVLLGDPDAPIDEVTKGSLKRDAGQTPSLTPPSNRRA